MFWIDSHLDLAWNALAWDRDLTSPVAAIRARERELGFTGPGRGVNTVSLPELRISGAGVVVATLLARHDRTPTRMTGLPPSGFSTREAANASALGQLAYYKALARSGTVTLLTHRTAFENHVQAWQNYCVRNPTGTPPPVGLVIAMEGADPILAPADLPDWHAAGVRMIGLCHFGIGHYSHGTDTTGPLFPAAKDLLREMDRLGILLDVTHLADEAMNEVFDLFPGQIVASHHNCRTLVPGQRQLRDTYIHQIAARDGVIGAAFDRWMLEPDFTPTNRPAATLETVVDHIDSVCQLTGSARHAGIGTDLDGGFGTEQSPADLDTIADVPRLADILTRRGYPPPDIAAILHGNWQRVLTSAMDAD